MEVYVTFIYMFNINLVVLVYSNAAVEFLNSIEGFLSVETVSLEPGVSKKMDTKSRVHNNQIHLIK